MGDRSTPKVLFLSCLTAFLAFFPSVEALVINSYDPARYDRFLSGTYPDSSTPNPDFFASSYDWSGVGWMSSDEMRSITMISPRHFVVANHWKIAAGNNVSFLNREGVLKTYEVADYSTFPSSFTDEDGSTYTYTSDLALGWLTDDIDDSDLVSHYPVLNADDPATEGFELDWYLNKDIYAYGWYAKAGENAISDFTWACSINTPQNPYADLTFCSTFNYQGSVPDPGLAGCQGGDSGSPTFIPWNGQLTVLGTHFGIDPPPPAESWTTYDAFIPCYLDEINVAMASGSLYSVDVINVIPEPMTCILFLSGIAGLLAVKKGN